MPGCPFARLSTLPLTLEAIAVTCASKLLLQCVAVAADNGFARGDIEPQRATEPLCKRALAIGEKALGSDHPGIGQALNNLADLYQAQGHYSEAEAELVSLPADDLDALNAKTANTGPIFEG